MTEGFDVGLEMSGVKSAFNTMLETMNTVVALHFWVFHHQTWVSIGTK